MAGMRPVARAERNPAECRIGTITAEEAMMAKRRRRRVQKRRVTISEADWQYIETLGPILKRLVRELKRARKAKR
jgi:hypothetical protein